MKIRLIFISIILGIFTTFWSSCDKVEDPLQIISQDSTTQGHLDPVFLTQSAITNTKHVLLEEFTGHKCVNCAGASMAAHDLAGTLNHRLIIYGVHAGYYAEPDPTGFFTMDFRTPTGDELHADFGVLANPVATINRIENSTLYNQGDWATIVNQEINKPNVVNLEVFNYYYPTKEKSRIVANVTFLQPLQGIYKLVVFIAEDDIVAPQSNNDPAVGTTPEIEEYEHRNVLRGSVTTTYGKLITDNEIEANVPYEFSFVVSFEENWVKDNCNFIVYVLNEETEEVLQVAEVHTQTTE